MLKLHLQQTPLSFVLSGLCSWLDLLEVEIVCTTLYSIQVVSFVQVKLL